MDRTQECLAVQQEKSLISECEKHREGRDDEE